MIGPWGVHAQEGEGGFICPVEDQRTLGKKPALRRHGAIGDGGANSLPLG